MSIATDKIALACASGFTGLARTQLFKAVAQAASEASLAVQDTAPEVVLRFHGMLGDGNVFGPNQVALDTTTKRWVVTSPTYQELATLDISNPEDPQIIGAAYIDPMMLNVCVHNGIAYGFDDDCGMHVVDLAYPDTEATYVGPPATGEISGAWHWPRVYVIGGVPHLFYNGHYPGGGDSGSILIYSLANPLSPSLVARYRHPDGSWGGGCCVVVGNRLYATDYFAREALSINPRILVVDISNISSPSLVSTVDLPNPLAIGNLNGWYLGYSNGDLYMCDAVYIQRIDISNPDLPVVSDVVSAPSDCEGIILDGYLFWGANGAQVINTYSIQAGSAPTLAGSFSQTYEGGGSVSHFWDADVENRRFVGFLDGIMAVWTY